MDVPQFYPIFRTPFTNIGGHLFTNQGDGKCNDFEMRAVECLEAYGTNRAKETCKIYFEDLDECIYSTKKKARLEAMDNERQRQYKEGIRTKETLYDTRSDFDGY